MHMGSTFEFLLRSHNIYSYVINLTYIYIYIFVYVSFFLHLLEISPFEISRVETSSFAPLHKIKRCKP